MGGTTPYLNRYKADDDDGFYDWCEFKNEVIIEKTKLIRTEITDLISQLTTKELQQVGIHPKLGRMNVVDWLNFFLLHESHHIYTIFGLKHRFYITEN